MVLVLPLRIGFVKRLPGDSEGVGVVLSTAFACIIRPVQGLASSTALTLTW